MSGVLGMLSSYIFVPLASALASLSSSLAVTVSSSVAALKTNFILRYKMKLTCVSLLPKWAPWDLGTFLYALFPLVLVSSITSILCDPTECRLLCPWDFPGENTEVGCPFPSPLVPISLSNRCENYLNSVSQKQLKEVVMMV